VRESSLGKPYPGKRAFDLLAAGSACLIFAPLVAAIALATVIEDGRPVLFVQTRLGRHRRPFAILKLRSMRDGEVTRVGRWLRKTGLDELPQFVNVCRGQMSVVGPRPLTADDVERLGWNQPEYDWRFGTKPGITGLSQLLAGRGVAASRRLDRLYQQRQSPMLDTRIVALSFVVNLVGKQWLGTLMRSAGARHELTRPRCLTGLLHATRSDTVRPTLSSTGAATSCGMKKQTAPSPILRDGTSNRT
jgi:lipopolysaccharide/colanic/teichoic acid biosynthesis glycosyltransferase